MQREVMWAPREGPGLEHLRLTLRDGMAGADGVIIGLNDDQAFRVHYEIQCDAAWCVREVRVVVLGAGAPTLHLRADGRGHWTDDGGRAVPDLDGCIDVDLSATAFTNTLPIRRLGLRPGESADLSVVYIDVPALAVAPVRQRYGCLACGPDGGRYRYESLPYEILPEGFTDELLVDAEGLVIDYPKLFRRVWYEKPIRL
jgi:hypothetical protein